MVVSVTVYLLIPMPIETESINLLLTTKQVVFSGGVFFFAIHSTISSISILVDTFLLLLLP